MNSCGSRNEITERPVNSKPYRMLRLPEVLTVSGLARSTVYKYITLGLFPQPIKICGGRCSGWPENEVLAAVKDSALCTPRAF